MEYLSLRMGAVLEIIFRSRFLMQKKSTNGLYKRLSTNKRLSTSWQSQRSLTLEGIITDSCKHLKFLRLLYFNPCLELRKNVRSNVRSNIRSNVRSNLRSNVR